MVAAHRAERFTVIFQLAIESGNESLHLSLEVSLEDIGSLAGLLLQLRRPSAEVRVDARQSSLDLPMRRAEQDFSKLFEINPRLLSHGSRPFQLRRREDARAPRRHGGV